MDSSLVVTVSRRLSRAWNFSSMVLRRKVIDARAIVSSDRGDTVKFESPQSAVVDIHLAAKVLYPFSALIAVESSFARLYLYTCT